MNDKIKRDLRIISDELEELGIHNFYDKVMERGRQMTGDLEARGVQYKNRRQAKPSHDWRPPWKRG